MSIGFVPVIIRKKLCKIFISVTFQFACLNMHPVNKLV